MKKRTKKILMIGGGVLIAYLLYKHFTKKDEVKTEKNVRPQKPLLKDGATKSTIQVMQKESQKDRVVFKDPMPRLKPNPKPYTFLGNEVQDSILRSASINKDVPYYVEPYSQNIQIRMPNGEMLTQAVTQKMITDNPDLEAFYQEYGYITSDQWQTAKGNISGRMPTGEAIF